MSPSRKDFISEAEELLDEAQGHLVDLRESPASGSSPETLNALFRSIHTLKGICGIFGLDGLKDLSHAIEGLLDRLRLGAIEPNDEVTSFLLKELDILRGLLREVEADEGGTDVLPYLEEIEEFSRRASRGGKGISLAGLVDDDILKALSEYEEHRLRTNISEGKGVFIVETVFNLSDLERELAAATAKIKEVAELISILPTTDDVPSDALGFRLLFASDKGTDTLKAALGTEPVRIAGKERPETPGQPSLRSLSTTLRVDIDKLDRILNTIGELTLTKGALKRIENELAGVYGQSHLVFDIHRATQSLERRLSELQQQVLETRMVPIGQIFSRLARVVRRYSQEIGKPVDLIFRGEATEIDKFIAEEIVDPLMHIVRNAIDHGIEDQEERTAKGKPARGRISIRAFQRGNHVVVETEDDGRGIDTEVIRKKAREKGIINVETELDDKELIEFIFRAGFSTKDEVTEVSGRGVGMDVVKERISAIGGFVEVATEKGLYTRLSIAIPITLAIIKSLLVRIGADTFALPLTSVSETLVVSGESIQSIEGKWVYDLRGDLLPVMSLADFFGIPSTPRERAYLVVSGHGERRVGLLVDELMGGQEIVIKSLGGYLEGLRGFAGAAEIGKHEVILVLDMETITEEALLRHKGLAQTQRTPGQEKG